MESALTLSSPPIFYSISFIISTHRNLSSHRRFTSISSPISVFPAEACETIGGDTSLADMFPEVKLERVANKTKHGLTTVLVDEACEVLGEEFCKYQS